MPPVPTSYNDTGQHANEGCNSRRCDFREISLVYCWCDGRPGICLLLMMNELICAREGRRAIARVREGIELHDSHWLWWWLVLCVLPCREGGDGRETPSQSTLPNWIGGERGEVSDEHNAVEAVSRCSYEMCAGWSVV